MVSRCILFRAPGVVDVTSMPMPSASFDEIVVETAFTCISPGTELRVLGGKQSGLPANPFPLVPGYAIVGLVVRTGATASAELNGRWVLCAGSRKSEFARAWGGHVSHAVVRASDVVVLPAGVSPRDAVLSHLAAISFRGMRMARPEKGETVAVLGLGVLGQLSVRLFALAGAEVAAGGLHEGQVRTAAAAGVRAYRVDRDNVDRLRSAIPKGADVVVDATGNPDAVTLSLSLSRKKNWDEGSVGGARLVMQGSYGDDLKFPHHEAFDRELTCLWPRWSHPDDLASVVGLLGQGLLKFDGLSRTEPVANAPEVYRNLSTDTQLGRTVVFDWGSILPTETSSDLGQQTASEPGKTLRDRLGRVFGR